MIGTFHEGMTLGVAWSAAVGLLPPTIGAGLGYLANGPEGARIGSYVGAGAGQLTALLNLVMHQDLLVREDKFAVGIRSGIATAAAACGLVVLAAQQP